MDYWKLLCVLLRNEYVYVCVCVPIPTHCTITRFGFHARWIYGVECGLFSNHAPLGQTHYVCAEYLYSVLYKDEVGVTVCVTVCVVWDDNERKGENETWCRLIACSSRKPPRWQSCLTSPSNGRIAINSTICLSTYILRKGLQFNPCLWFTI